MSRRVQVTLLAIFWLASVAYGLGIIVGYVIGAF